MRLRYYFLLPIIFIVVVGLVKCTNTVTEEQVTIAFIGDQGLNANARAVLEMIEAEGANMVLHQGDFDYIDDADAWDEQINDVLGEDFPYFASIGNHDIIAWDSGYKIKLQERLARIEGAECSGEYGVNAHCSYKGIFFILSGAGTLGSGHANYIEDKLANDNSRWRICSWHKNQALMQAGSKTDEVNWDVYENCRLGGAIIMTGHEHMYSRTYLMSSFEEQEVVNESTTLTIEKGRSFVVVSGIAGKSIRTQSDVLAANPWWASIYSATQDANHGALFCSFNTPSVGTATCYFKDLDGNTPDEFTIESEINQ